MHPTAAERVRTICARSSAAQLAGDRAGAIECPLHHVMADGLLALSVGNRTALGVTAANAPVVLELLDEIPTPQDQGVRALVWIRGRVRPLSGGAVRPVIDAIAAENPHPALLDIGHRDTLLLMNVESVVFADASGAETVDPHAVLAARPDPFCGVEAAWVRHLHDHHAEMVERLRLHLPRGKRQGRIRLLGLDRYGLMVRTEGAQGTWDSRVPFRTSVDDDAALCRALRSLMACPFEGGLRPRGQY